MVRKLPLQLTKELPHLPALLPPQPMLDSQKKESTPHTDSEVVSQLSLDHHQESTLLQLLPQLRQSPLQHMVELDQPEDQLPELLMPLELQLLPQLISQPQLQLFTPPDTTNQYHKYIFIK